MKHRPKRSLGQNFLRDEQFIDQIIAAVDPRPNEQVVEIGPGQGALTERLIESDANVTAIEVDPVLVADLQRRFGNRLHLIEADVLGVDWNDVVREAPVKVVGNLPYNISTPILQRLIEERHLFSSIVLMFQREVVERITAQPGNSERGYLTVLTETAFEVEYLFEVPPAAFYPVPKVWSAVVRLTPKPRTESEGKLREAASQGFAHKRKTLANNLTRYYSDPLAAIRAADLPDKCRAEELSLTDWLRLIAHL